MFYSDGKPIRLPMGPQYLLSKSSQQLHYVVNLSITHTSCVPINMLYVKRVS